MVPSMQSAATALTAFQKKLNVTADNIANVNTDEFKKTRVTMKEGENGGVEAETQQIETRGYIKRDQESGITRETESSNVDLPEEMVELTLSRRGCETNLKSIQTSDEMLGSLLDILG